MSDHAALATHALGLGSATTAASLRAELAHLERRRRHAIELEALCERKRRGHEEAVRQLDLAIEALEVELDG